jgi:hypothetical protein
VRFFEQTPVALFEFEGTIHVHTPDFVIEWRSDKLTVVDVKARDVKGSRRYVSSRIRQRRFGKKIRRRPIDYAAKAIRDRKLLETAAAVYRRFGMDHLVVPAEELHEPHRTANVNRIFPHRFAQINLHTRLSVRHRLQEAKDPTLGALLQHVSLSESELSALIALGDVRVDLNLPLNDSTPIAAGDPIRDGYCSAI